MDVQKLLLRDLVEGAVIALRTEIEGLKTEVKFMIDHGVTRVDIEVLNYRVLQMSGEIERIDERLIEVEKKTSIGQWLFRQLGVLVVGGVALWLYSQSG